MTYFQANEQRIRDAVKRRIGDWNKAVLPMSEHSLLYLPFADGTRSRRVYVITEIFSARMHFFDLNTLLWNPEIEQDEDMKEITKKRYTNHCSECNQPLNEPNI